MILTKRECIDHVYKLVLTLNKMKGKVIKYDIERSFFGQTEMEYVGFYVIRNGVKPMTYPVRPQSA